MPRTWARAHREPLSRGSPVTIPTISRGLTCDYLVTYLRTRGRRRRRPCVQGTRPIRRGGSFFDRLFDVTAQNARRLKKGPEMTRFGVMKHLRVLGGRGSRGHTEGGAQQAALPQPGPDPADPRPVDRQVARERQVSALADLKHRAGRRDGMSVHRDDRHRDPGLPRLHQGIAAGDLGCDHDARVDGESTATPASRTTSFAAGGAYKMYSSEAMRKGGAEMGLEIPDVIIDGEVLEIRSAAQARPDLAHAHGSVARGREPTRLTWEIRPRARTA